MSKSFVRRLRLFRTAHVNAVDDVSLTIPRGSTLAVVGESGSGKSTLARCIAGLETPDSGQILLNQQNLLALRSTDRLAFHRQVQLVFQQSATAMNPRFSALEVVSEPLRIQKFGNQSERREQALAALAQVGLSHELARRSVFECSGGQRQRLSLARALVLRPSLLLLDEAMSGLDLPLQQQLLTLLLHLQRELHLTLFFITHDIRLAAQIAPEIAVMRQGKVLEIGPTDVLFRRPQHPYTKQLLDAIPNFPPGPTPEIGPM